MASLRQGVTYTRSLPPSEDELAGALALEEVAYDYLRVMSEARDVRNRINSMGLSKVALQAADMLVEELEADWAERVRAAGSGRR